MASNNLMEKDAISPFKRKWHIQVKQEQHNWHSSGRSGKCSPTRRTFSWALGYKWRRTAHPSSLLTRRQVECLSERWDSGRSPSPPCTPLLASTFQFQNLERPIHQLLILNPHSLLPVRFLVERLS